MKIRPGFWPIVLVLLPHGSAWGQDLARLAIEGNESAIGSIHSLYSKVRYQIQSPGTPREQQAEYWRVDETVRIREANGPDSREIRVQGGRTEVAQSARQTAAHQGRTPILRVIDGKDTHVTEVDAWQLSLFDLPVMIQRKTSYSRFSLASAARAGRVHDAEWITSAGSRCIRLTIDLAQDRRSYEVQVDPALNWLITDCHHRIRDEAGLDFWDLHFHVRKAREIKPAIFVPEQVDFTYKMQGRVILQGTASFEAIAVNDSLPPVPAMPSLAANSMVVDKVDGVTTLIDASGRRARTARLGERVLDVLPVEEDHESLSNRAFLGWTGIVLALGLMGIAVVWQRRRARLV